MNKCDRCLDKEEMYKKTGEKPEIECSGKSKQLCPLYEVFGGSKRKCNCCSNMAQICFEEV